MLRNHSLTIINNAVVNIFVDLLFASLDAILAVGSATWGAGTGGFWYIVSFSRCNDLLDVAYSVPPSSLDVSVPQPPFPEECLLFFKP